MIDAMGTMTDASLRYFFHAGLLFFIVLSSPQQSDDRLRPSMTAIIMGSPAR
ncbi:hypothetical protein K466DRAFT_213701 [Polyporus arcularius HHB13444]|uniref:Uncharacterized protein n=1 Tax=Polyporus arcularius HHB13444 TaxID=1314778 RepID=A0A5C3P787_9APHY|nr:hypothetical protein K466DRAFT_213701 [Polyporus arcularius HHB13444]